MALDDPEIVRKRNGRLFRFRVPARGVAVRNCLIREAKSFGDCGDDYGDFTIQLSWGMLVFGNQLSAVAFSAQLSARCSAAER
jgi:hypothetical protein